MQIHLPTVERPHAQINAFCPYSGIATQCSGDGQSCWLEATATGVAWLKVLHTHVRGELLKPGVTVKG
jgi:hypothetical protein